MNEFNVCIISTFGRGHWLAAELNQQGQSVALMDLTPNMGRWTPEDWEGPFGFWQADQLRPSQVSRVAEEDYLDVLPQGFVLWTSSGPIELNGPLMRVQMDRFRFHPEVMDYLGGARLTAPEMNRIRSVLTEQSFQANWFAGLACSLASSVWVNNWKVLDAVKVEPLPLFAPYAIRRASRRGLERSLDRLSQQGIKVFREALWRDLEVDRIRCGSIEVTSNEGSGVVRADEYVICLTGHEIKSFMPQILPSLYSGAPPEHEWVWIRYRVAITRAAVQQVLPLKFLLLDDHHLSWSHDNLIWLQQTANASKWDAWARIPAEQRFSRDYVHRLGDQIIEKISYRLPGAQVGEIEWPQDALYEFADLGPSLYGQYLPEDLIHTRRREFLNLSFAGPEEVGRMDWTGRFAQNEKVMAELERRREQRSRMAKNTARVEL